MSETKRFEDLSPEEQKETLKAYQELTDNKTALEDLEADIDARRQGYGEVWATGFTELDKKLDGGFMGEQLIFLGAISSLGKTSYALQIATQIAEQGKDVLIFSLEMSKNELNAKTISRYTHILTQGKKNEYRQKYRLTTRDILSGKVGSMVFKEPQDDQAHLFTEALDATKKIAGNVRIFVGENDVDVDKIRECDDIWQSQIPFHIEIFQCINRMRFTKRNCIQTITDTAINVVAFNKCRNRCCQTTRSCTNRGTGCDAFTHIRFFTIKDI